METGLLSLASKLESSSNGETSTDGNYVISRWGQGSLCCLVQPIGETKSLYCDGEVVASTRYEARNHAKPTLGVSANWGLPASTTLSISLDRCANNGV